MTNDSLLSTPGVCWRRARAERAAPLVDTAAYFQALRHALLRAERQVMLVGWDVDGRADLPRDPKQRDDAAPTVLRDLLTWLVDRRPDLHVHVLLWDYTLLYALDREPLPSITLGWTTPHRVHLHLDNHLPMEASHHEKVVVIDDALAFCGGMDVTIRRWDTPDHALSDPRRHDPGGDAYPPVHDVMLMVDGEAARALGDLARERWHGATAERLPAPPPPSVDAWPEAVAPAFRAVPLGISRTRPGFRKAPPVHEIRDLYSAAIASAERVLYIENQYLTADSVAEALARRLQEVPELEVLLVGPRTAMDWLEETTMGVGRATFMARLAAAGGADRVRLLAPLVREDGQETDIKVHSKLMIVDDRILTVGSANIANRSMGLDSETNVTVEAAHPEDRAAILRLRDGLLAEHLDRDQATVTAAIHAAGGGLLKAVDTLRAERPDARRTLAAVRTDETPEGEAVALLQSIGDPERPIDIERFLQDQVPEPPVGRSRRPRLRHLWTGLFMVTALVAVIALWELTPLRQALDPDTLLRWADQAREQWWAPLAVVGGYVVLGLAAFPVTVLITVTAMMFGPALGFVYATAGALSSAVISFAIGHALGKRLVRRYAGATVNRLSQALGRRGIVTVVFLRVAPVAPFLLINLVSGASHVAFRDFLLGTLLGMVPGIAVMTLLGSSLMDLIQDPSPLHIALMAGCLALWALVSVGLQRWVSRRQRRSDRRAGGTAP